MKICRPPPGTVLATTTGAKALNLDPSALANAENGGWTAGHLDRDARVRLGVVSR
jgi:hypothetical protein